MLLAAPAAVQAHPPPRMTTRELVRIQGHRTDAATEGVKRRLILVTLGVEQPFAATDWQVFGLSDAPPRTEPSPSATQQRFSPQGSREVLSKLVTARREQTVTILAERRPGSADLFVLTLDFCPLR